EGGLELTLPWRVGREREAGRELAARVQIEQLRGHLANRGARLVTLPLPRGGAELVETRCRRHAVAIRGGAIGLELVEAVQRNVEAVAPLVLDDRDFERAAVGAHGDRLDTAINADPVLQVHHEVPPLERLRRRGERLAVDAR